MTGWTDIAKIALAALVLLGVIAAVVLFTFIGSSSANRSGEQLAESVAAFDARTYDTYDQTTVSGVTAMAAIKNFRDRSVTVVVRTASETVYRVYGANFLTTDPGDDAHTTTVPNAAGVGAAKSGTRANHDVSGIVATRSVWPLSQNTGIGPATDKSKDSYVNPTAKFRSVLIYNENDQPIGILLEQVGATNSLL